MAVCHRGLSVVKAFCFLEDLCWAFKACFDGKAISLAARPYPFLEFGAYEEAAAPTFGVTHHSILDGTCVLRATLLFLIQTAVFRS